MCYLTTPNNPGIVICTGLANGMAEPRYLFPIMARCLNHLGYNVMLFDYLGNGDSECDFREVCMKSIVDSTRGVIEYVNGLGIEKIGIIGYGVGNVVASSMVQHSNIDFTFLIAPYFEVFDRNNSWFWDNLEKTVINNCVFPQNHNEKYPIAKIWQALVGEEIHPTQPCGPLNINFLREVKSLNPVESLIKANKPVIIVSDNQKDDLRNYNKQIDFALIPHQVSVHKQSWHWCANCRELIVGKITNWCDSYLRENTTYNESKASICLTEMLPDDQKFDYEPKTNIQICSVTARSENEDIFGVLHIPMKNELLRKKCIIYIPGLPGQRVDIHTCGKRMAQYFVKDGYYVFRYDSRGMGVSMGEFHKVTTSRLLCDLFSVMDYLSEIITEYCREFILISNSAGAKIACLALNQRDDVKACAFWGPTLIDPRDSRGNTIMKRHSDGSIVIEYCGLWLGIKYHLDERTYDYVEEFNKCDKERFIIVSEDDRKLLPTYNEIIGTCAGKEVQIVERKGPHGFRAEDIDEIMNLTLEWVNDLK